MQSIQPHTHAFIVKIWSEESHDKFLTPPWRGQITHVPSGQRRHFTNLTSMNDFVITYIDLPVELPDTNIRFMQKIWRWFQR